MKQNLSSVDIQDFVFDPVGMLTVIRMLSKILTEEVDLLRDMKLSQIHKSYNDKMELALILEGYKQSLMQNPKLLESMPSRILNELQNEAKKFGILVEEGQKQINRAKEVHKIVMEAIRKTLEKDTIKSSGYNKNGLIDVRDRGEYITPPVSVNQNI